MGLFVFFEVGGESLRQFVSMYRSYINNKKCHKYNTPTCLIIRLVVDDNENHNKEDDRKKKADH